MKTPPSLRKLSLFVFAATAFAMGSAHVEAETYLFDFGGPAFQTITDGTNVWNTLPTSVATTDFGVLNGIVTTDNETSFMELQMVRKFNGLNENGTKASTLFPITATQDSLYGNTEDWQGLSNIFPAFKLTGLDETKKYNFTFYASRMDVGDIRTTKYTISGGIVGNTTTLNVANNIGNTTQVFGITPDEFNEILIELNPAADNNNGFHFTYLGVLKVEVVPEPSSALMLISGVGVLVARRRRQAA